MSNNLTIGNPMRLILMFSVPLLIGNIFQQFYSMADTVIVGRTLGVQALAAVGSTGAISFLVIGFVQGVTSGFTVITAQRFGAGDLDGMRRSVATSILLSVGVTVVVTAVSVATTRLLLEVMQTPADIIDSAYNYIVVIYWGIAAAVFYNLISSIIRALGDSKTPLLFLIVASILNIILDFLFIIAFKMGVAGAGWATVIAQAVSGFLCLLFIRRRYPILMLHRKDWKFDWTFAWQHLKIGLPMAFQFSITAIGVMVLQTVLNSFGSTTVAAYTAASKIEQFTTQPLNALGMAMVTYAAQNHGAGRMDRVRDGLRKSSLISLGFSILSGLVVVFLGRSAVQLFVGAGQPEVYDQAQTYLNIVAVFYFALGLLFIFRNALQGMGWSIIPMMAGVTELVMRTVVALAFSHYWGYLGVCFASPIAWVGASALLLGAYFASLRKQKKLAARSHETG